MVLLFLRRLVIFSKEKSIVRKIAWLTIVGLTISLAALLIVLCVMTALNIGQKERTLAVEPHLSIEIPQAQKFITIENHPVHAKLNENENYFVSAYEMQDVILRTMDGRFRGAVARGVTWQSLQNMMQNVRPTGHKTDESPKIVKPDKGEVIIGVDLAHSLGVFEGDTLMVVPPEGLLLPPDETPKYERVKVKQILVTNVSEIDGQYMYFVSGEALRTLSETASRKLGIEVRFLDPDVADDVKQSLSGFNDIRVETWRERNSALFFALKLEKFMIGFFLSLAAMVAGLSMLSVITLLISQKRKEIGLLQAVGLSLKKTQDLFTRIGFLLAASGIVMGVIIGLAVSLYLQWKPLNVLPDIYYDSQVKAYVDPVFVSVVIIASLLFSYFGSAWAVKKAQIQEASLSLRGKHG